MLLHICQLRQHSDCAFVWPLHMICSCIEISAVPLLEIGHTIALYQVTCPIIKGKIPTLKSQKESE